MSAKVSVVVKASMEPSLSESPLPPLFSVVIPALNEERALPRCLASLTAQVDMPLVEIIVVDNCSTNGTANVALANGARVVECPVREL